MARGIPLTALALVYALPSFADSICKSGPIIISSAKCGASLSIGEKLIAKCLKADSQAFKTLVKECQDTVSALDKAVGDKFPKRTCGLPIHTKESANKNRKDGFTISVGVDRGDVMLNRDTNVAIGSAIDNEIRTYCESARAGSSTAATKKSGGA